ncbi:MAG: ABC transporter ATP-binding protein [Propionibacteriaceae bacterium]|jgi:putative ABC transport system ATP-binding protein|nr:ABC transporter ATP-binding protein [Propionibacteriaceae bacterium]
MTPILSLDHVTKSYGPLNALDDVTAQVPEGEWLSVTGPSGSGKTTLMNIVGCLDRATSGTVTLAGTELTDRANLTEIRRNLVGLIFQKFHLIPHLSAVENVMVAQYYHSLPDEREALLALDRVGLAERAHHLPSQLSGGEQQRVCIARALINDPKLVLADEPTGNLDAANEAIVLDLFRRLHADGATLIVVTHDPTVAAQGDREIALDHGRIHSIRRPPHPGADAAPDAGERRDSPGADVTDPPSVRTPS